MASIAGRRAPPLMPRLRNWWEEVRFTERQKRVAAIAALLATGAFWGALVGVAGVAGALLCVSLFACIFIIRDFRFGAALLILLMPISESYIFPRSMFGVTGMNPLNLLLLTTAVSLYMRYLGSGTLKNFVPRTLLFLYLLPLAMGAALGAFRYEEVPTLFRDLELISFDTAFGYVRDMLLKPLTIVFYALLVAAAVRRSDQPERFIAPMLVSVFVMAMLAIVFVLTSHLSLSQLAGTFSRQLFSALGMHANDLGRLYATAYALLLFLWDRSERLGVKTLLVLMMGVVAIALLLTFSRGAFFSFVVVNLIYLVARRSLKTMALAVVLVPIAAWLAPGALWYRVSMGMGEGMNEVSAGRTNEIWAPLLPELLDSPFWGQGIGAILWSKAMLEGRLMQVAHPHNAYLQAYMDMGLIGLLFLTAFWIYVWARCLRYAKDPRLTPYLQGYFEGSAAGILAFLIAGFAGSSLEPVAAQAFMWLAAGVMYGVTARLAVKIS